MIAEIYWIDEKLAIMPRPRGNEWIGDEIISLKNFGVDILVSLLEYSEISELELIDEEDCCGSYGIIFLNFPITDRDVPKSFDETHNFIRKLSDYYREGKKIAIHCRAGIGRSSLIACAVLVLHGENVDDAFLKISQARGFPVPDTQAQIEWVEEFSDKIFGSHG
jgi:protein-tyrosine phosphatase